jgi:hypothetical protein
LTGEVITAAIFQPANARLRVVALGTHLHLALFAVTAFREIRNPENNTED